jgi:site-specific DNA-cytosine methylase
VARAIQSRYSKGYSHHAGEVSGVIHQINQPTHSNDRVYSEDGVSPSLNTMQGGRRQPKIIQLPRGKNNGGEHLIAPTITGKSYQNNNFVNRVRRLIPLECERLMSWPDNWTKEPNISDTQRYKMCGNGVVSKVVEAIIEKM